MYKGGAIRVVDPSEYSIKMSNYAYKPNGISPRQYVEKKSQTDKLTKNSFAPLVGQTKKVPKLPLKRELTYTDEPEDAHVAATYTNVQIDVGICDDDTIVVRIRSFSDLKLPKIGQPQKITLPNGVKCVFYEKEIKCRLMAGSRIVSIVGKLFQGSQRPIPKEPVITNIKPTIANISSIDVIVKQLNLLNIMGQIANYPPSVRYVYLMIIREISKFNVDINIDIANFETSPAVSPITTPTSTPRTSPTATPTTSSSSSPTKGPIGFPNFAAVVKHSPQKNSDTAKPMLILIPKSQPEPVKIKSFGNIYFIDSQIEGDNLKHCGSYSEICPRH